MESLTLKSPSDLSSKKIIRAVWLAFVEGGLVTFLQFLYIHFTSITIISEALKETLPVMGDLDEMSPECAHMSAHI
jgi:hypothetical protein